MERWMDEWMDRLMDGNYEIAKFRHCLKAKLPVPFFEQDYKSIAKCVKSVTRC